MRVQSAAANAIFVVASPLSNPALMAAENAGDLHAWLGCIAPVPVISVRGVVTGILVSGVPTVVITRALIPGMTVFGFASGHKKSGS